jgi:hypothetical protein
VNRLSELERDTLRILAEVAVERHPFLRRKSPAQKKRAAKAMVGFLMVTRSGMVEQSFAHIEH